MKGHSEQARARINAALASTREPTPAIAAWANSTLAEIAVMRGDRADAEQILRAMLRDDANDSYALALLADVLLASGRAADAATLLHGHDIVDNLLVRHAIAAHQAQAPEAFELRAQMQARMAAAAERHDRIHAREEAMYVLAVDGDAPRAATIALENWQVQKELADARLLMACGQAAGDRTAITTVTEWMTAHGIVDATLMAAIGGAK
jgi:predicted Zn-dependent protease